MTGNTEEILHEMAQLTKTAYIHLGNKMVYGTADQEKIKELAAKKATSTGLIMNH